MSPSTLEEYAVLVREDLEDFPASNEQLDFEEEFGPKAIQRALEKALSRFNRMAPNIGDYGFAAFPAPGLLVDMAIIALMQRAVFKRARNTLSYSDAGLSIDDQNWQAYRAILNDMMASVMPEAKEIKAAINITRGFGSVSSVYRNV